MNEIDELIERLKGFAIECAEINQKCAELADNKKLNVLAEDTDWWKAATALQKMQGRINALEAERSAIFSLGNYLRVTLLEIDDERVKRAAKFYLEKITKIIQTEAQRAKGHE